jgi:hypothetical protein
MKIGDTIFLYSAEIHEFSGLHTDMHSAIEEVKDIGSDADTEIHTYQGIIETEHRNFWIVKINHIDYVDSPYLAIHKQENDWILEGYITINDLKADIDKEDTPNPEMLTDLWQRKWWF